jgi:hypothetical protein
VALPQGWDDFGRRWQAWRQRHDRRCWASSWQGEAFRQGCLRFPSPWDDQLLETRLSLRVGNQLAYLLRDGKGRRALVFAGLVTNGHELEAVYLPEDNAWLHAPVSVAPPRWYAQGLERLAAQLEEASAEADGMAPQRRQRLWLEGHPNFAHQLLNGLTCLDQVDGAALGPVLKEGPEAFGPLRELFPAVLWLDAAEAEAGAWFELPLSQRPDRISRDLRRLLLRYAAAHQSSTARQLEQRLQTWKAGGGWVLAVSVKARGAVAEGLNGLLAAWLAALARQGPLPLLLIDGFSLPSGASSATVVPPYLCPMGEVISAEAEQIRQLDAVLAAAGLQPERLVCAGRPLLEALQLLQYADGYFMHQGTVQHKIGWFQESVPGIVHSNSHRNCGGSHPWGGMGETAPIWFPAEGCEDLEDAPRGSYRFRPDWEHQGVAWLCDQLRELGINTPRTEPEPADDTRITVQAESLHDLDTWVLDRSLRRYQQWIVDQIPFGVAIEGTAYSFHGCRTTADRNHLELHRCSDGAAFVLRSDRCGSGFSLIQSRPEPLTATPPATPWLDRAPVLRIGDPNFAHFLWNELDPLLHLLNRAQQRGERLAVVQDSDSVLDLSSLEGVALLPPAVLEQRPSVHVGAMRVSEVARRTVLASLGAPPVAKANPAKPPLLLLGVRGPGRRELLDEDRLLPDVIRQLHQRWPTLRICLDGFTFQHNNRHDPASLARSDAIAARIARIQAACPGIALETLHGLSFESYLPRVAEASLYITHEGTIQHKIGWMYPEIPGLCLVAGPHGEAVGRWHRDQCEGADHLAVLPTGLLEHATDGHFGSGESGSGGGSGDSGTEEEQQQRDQPFECRDPVAMIEAIERLLAPHLDRLTATQAEPEAADLVAVVWQSSDPGRALTAFLQRGLAEADGSHSRVFELCLAACLSRDSAHLDAAGERLARLPADDPWVRLHRLRLQIARGDQLEQLQDTALSLLDAAEQLDASSRQLLASLLSSRLEPLQLALLLPEFSQQHLQLLQGRQGDPAAAAVLAARLLEQMGNASPQHCTDAGSLYGQLATSLRRPFQSWDSPEVADPARLDDLVDRISAALREGRGFGVIRLGDGEGRFLAGQTSDLEGATRNGDRCDPALEAAGGHLPAATQRDLLERFRQALQQADVVGIPDLWQCLAGPEQSFNVAAHLDASPARVWAGGWHLHLQLLQHGAFSRSPFDQVRAVIGTALPPLLRGAGVDLVALPGEDPHWNATPRPEAHYPLVYQQVLQWIDGQVGPGQLVLVGGGLLGKIYVGAIQARGGVGIDVGSVIDLCCGHTGHRGEHRLNPYLATVAAQAFAVKR